MEHRCVLSPVRSKMRTMGMCPQESNSTYWVSAGRLSNCSTICSNACQQQCAVTPDRCHALVCRAACGSSTRMCSRPAHKEMIALHQCAFTSGRPAQTTGARSPWFTSAAERRAPQWLFLSEWWRPGGPAPPAPAAECCRMPAAAPRRKLRGNPAASPCPSR